MKKASIVLLSLALGAQAVDEPSVSLFNGRDLTGWKPHGDERWVAEEGEILDYVDPTPKYTDGVIALQLHSGGEGKMRFKDIAIREAR